MKNDEFVKEIITLIADNAAGLDPKPFKRHIRFGKGKNAFSEIRFDYFATAEGYTVGLSSENKEIGDFFEKESGEPFLKRVWEMPEIRNCFFRQDSFCGSYYQHPFPVLTDDDSGIIDPDLGSAVFDDILKNLQTYHFQFIRDAAALSPDLLYYIHRFPSNFRHPASLALFLIEKHRLPLHDSRVQGLFEYDEMVMRGEYMLSSRYDLIFGTDKHEQVAKQRILQRK